jgi:DHA3 family macrolide efflux protein-like MFS transporter
MYDTQRQARGSREGAMTHREEPNLRPFLVLWTGQSVSLLGSSATQFAVIWWLTSTTGSASILALATLVGLAPQIVLGPIAGALVDRWPRKRVMGVSDAVAALAAAVLALLFVSGNAGVVHVLLLLFVRSLAGAFHGSAMFAATSLMVPPEHLTRIQGLNQLVQGGSTIIGAPAGALLFAALPMAGVMLVDVGSAAVALAALGVVRVPEPGDADLPEGVDAGAAKAATADRPRLWGDIVDGFRWVLSRRGHTLLIATAALVNLLLVPALSLLPLLVAEAGHGPGAYAALTSCFGIGTLGGGILLGAWGGFGRRVHTALAGMIGLGASTAALGAVPAAWGGLALVAALGLGASGSLTNGPIHAILQATVEPRYQGRVITLTVSLATAMTPLGLVAAAPTAELLGARAWYVASGLVCLLVAGAAFLVRPLAEIEAADRPLTERPF